jgi:hypothetical protein
VKLKKTFDSYRLKMVGAKIKKKNWNFIDYSKILKNNNQKDMEQLRRKNKLQRLVWIFKGGNIEFEVEREREGKKEMVIDIKPKIALEVSRPFKRCHSRRCLVVKQPLTRRLKSTWVVHFTHAPTYFFC